MQSSGVAYPLENEKKKPQRTQRSPRERRRKSPAALSHTDRCDCLQKLCDLCVLCGKSLHSFNDAQQDVGVKCRRDAGKSRIRPTLFADGINANRPSELLGLMLL